MECNYSIIQPVVLFSRLNYKWRGDIEVLGDSLSQSPFVQHEFRLECPGLEACPPRWNTGAY